MSGIKGAFAVATSAAVPGQDPFELNERNLEEILVEIKTGPVPALLPMVGDADTGIFSAAGDKLSIALARSINETKEQVTANVLNRAFEGMDD